MQKDFDLAIIGGGPAGYAAAIRGTQLGAKVCLIEEKKVGGSCLNSGCIPTKTLYKSAQMIREMEKADLFGIEVDGCRVNLKKVIERKDQIVRELTDGVGGLLKRGNVEQVWGRAEFADSRTLAVEGSGLRIKAGRIIIATGSKNFLPPIPGIDGANIIDSSAALSLTQLPARIAVIGGGVIGCEFASIFRAFGSEVTVIEMLPRLIANSDADCGRALEKNMTLQGIEVCLDADIENISDLPDGKKEIVYKSGSDSRKLAIDKVLLAAGRVPDTINLGLDAVGVKTNNGSIMVDEYMRTSAEGIYAAGDVTGRELFAHVAYEEAAVAVENALGSSRTMNYLSVPKSIFTFPEIGSVGLSEQEARERGYELVVAKFPLRGSGKAIILGDYDGFVKIVAAVRFNRILGIHIVGPQASELVGEAALAISLEATLDDLAATIHAHPSVAESLKEAAMMALNRSLHV
ncbi:MAG: dihydrolipoyl dehydrogenase [Dethiobacter sp.]|nr:dihydrolipoyl dehydrogenase [Dethiobacter sp.]